MSGNFTIESGGFELLPGVESLWYELKAHHLRIDPCFPDMSTPGFELRTSGLKERAKDLLVELVLRNPDGRAIGYCFSSIDRNDVGEIESMYVREEFRGQGIGGELVTRALCWMDRHRVVAKRVSVLGGNREAMAFYGRFGFRTRVLELMIPTNGKSGPPAGDVRVDDKGSGTPDPASRRPGGNFQSLEF